ncbi:MAG: MXAN_6640 family putative metalloprotease [Melioribacteraceae bacterium]|nr:MXAN_6640 family putative metalloprotease [Melioribacteraceae bacterium]
MNRFLFLVGVISIFISINAHENETIEKIEEAYLAGQIDYEQALLQKFYAGFDRSKLYQDFSVSNQSVEKCATHLIAEYRNNLDKLSDQTINIIDELIKPAARKGNNSISSETYISPYGKFELTYSTSGSNGVPSQDLDNSGVPDFVEHVANYFDHSWKVLIDTLGFKPIPLSPGEYYQISFEDMPYYGYTTWTNTSAGTEIVMHNNYQGFPSNTDPDGNVLGAAKVTAVHEFKHAIQFIYANWGEPGWFIEADATWSEDIGFDATNDYYNYLGSSQIRQPGRGLAQGDGYEDNLYFHYFTEKFGDNTNREIWERREQFSESVYSSVSNMLANYGAFFDEAFAEYYTWLYNTGNRYNPNLPGFGEASSYPTSILCRTISDLPYEGEGCGRAALSGNFLLFNSQYQNQYLQLLLDTPNGNNVAGIIFSYTDGTTNTEFYELDNSNVFDLFVEPKLSEIEEVIVVLAATSTSGSNFDYVFSFDAFQTAEFDHQPFSDTETGGDIEFVVNVNTPQNLAYIDSLKLFYQINESGFISLPLLATGNTDEYSATVPDPGSEVQIDYYFRVADQLGQQIFFPESAPDSAFSFYIGADNQPPVVQHNTLLGTPKFNFPLPVYAVISDNVGLDSTYIEYRLNEGDWIKTELQYLGGNIFFGSIEYSDDELSEGDLVDYKITAIDNSSNKNITRLPENNFFRLDIAEGYYYNRLPNVEINETKISLLATQDVLTIEDDFNIEDINIYFESDNLFFSDLAIELVDPQGSKYILSDQAWLETSNTAAGFPTIIFDHEAYFNISDAYLADTLFASGTFAPSNSDLTQLYGSSTKGDWKIRVYDKGINGETGILNEWGLIIKGNNLTSVDENNGDLITSYELYQNYPNPFNPSTTVKFNIPAVETGMPCLYRRV